MLKHIMRVFKKLMTQEAMWSSIVDSTLKLKDGSDIVPTGYSIFFNSYTHVTG